MEKNTRIGIIGAGAIGGVLAGVLTRDGYQVQLLVRQEDLAQKISKKGLKVKGECGKFTIPVPTVSKPGELSGPFDYVLIATKAEDLLDAAHGILPYLDKETRVVSLQNGICEEILADVVGEERTIGCVIGFGSSLCAPGKVEMTSGGEIIIGNWNREPDEQLEQLSDILGHVVKTRTTDKILPELYSKLIVNSSITTLGVACGQPLGEMLVTRKARNLFIALTREAMEVAGAMGITVPPGAGGKVDYYKFLSTGPLSGLRRHLIIRVIGIKYKKLRSSSLQSLERGRKTEVDIYNGYIVAKGKELGVSTPVNAQLTRMIKEIEQGTRKITPENFNEISKNNGSKSSRLLPMFRSSLKRSKIHSGA
jgi:2-dehydropantoate 2-reductase